MEAEALDAGQDVGCAGGLDVGFDGVFEIGDRAEHPSFQGAFGEQERRRAGQ